MSDEEEDDDVDLAGVVPAGQAAAAAGGGGQITADFFRQAMQMVYAREGQPTSAQPLEALAQPPITAVTEVGLDKLCFSGDMEVSFLNFSDFISFKIKTA